MKPARRHLCRAAIALVCCFYSTVFHAAGAAHADDGDALVNARRCNDELAGKQYHAAIEACSAALANPDLPADMRLPLLIQRAEVHLGLGSGAKAAADLSSVLDETPDDVRARYLRALAYKSAGKESLAIDDIRAVVDSGSGDSQHYEFYADLLSSGGDYPASIEALKRGLLAHPGDLRLTRALAFVYNDVGDYPVAIDLLGQIIDQSPDDEEAIYVRANSRIGLAEFTEARGDLDLLLERDPERGLYRNVRAYVNLKLGALDLAESDLDRRSNEFFVWYVHERIQFDRGLGGVFSKARKMSPNNADAFLAGIAGWVSGRRYLGEDGLRDIRAQVEYIRRTQELSMESGPMMCLLLGAFGDFANAGKVCDEIIAAAPKHGEAWRARAFLKLRLGDLASALTDWERAVDISPEDALAHYGLGYTLLLMNKDSEGQASIAQAKSLVITVGSYFDRWGFQPGSPPRTPEALVPIQ